MRKPLQNDKPLKYRKSFYLSASTFAWLESEAEHRGRAGCRDVDADVFEVQPRFAPCLELSESLLNHPLSHRHDQPAALQ